MGTNQVARTNPSIVDALMKLIIVTRLCIDYDESCIQWMLLIDGRVYAALLYLSSTRLTDITDTEQSEVDFW